MISNDSRLLIHDVGDVNSSVKDVFISPELFTSLISVGQLVDDD
jgi:hypothetical protein